MSFKEGFLTNRGNLANAALKIGEVALEGGEKDGYEIYQRCGWIAEQVRSDEQIVGRKIQISPARH